MTPDVAATVMKPQQTLIIWVYLTGVNPNFFDDPLFVLSARYQLEACREPAANVGDQLRNPTVSGLLAGVRSS